MLDAVVAQNEQAISIDGEKHNYKKVIMVEQDKAERQGVTLMKIDSAMKEVQKRIQQTVKKRMKMLEHYAKILLKVEQVEGNIEKVNAEIATFEFEIKVLHIRTFEM
jgi:septal ring factor EnvC (AmiA/AmiB activator)